MTGKVYQLNVKSKTPGERGLPKHPVHSIRAGVGGVEGDHNKFRQENMNGDPDSAIMIMTLEKIQELNAAEDPNAPANIGGQNPCSMGVDSRA